MIVRPKQHWLQLIFVWHGSVLPKIYTRLLLNFLLSIAVILMLPADLATPDPELIRAFGDKPVLVARLLPAAPPPPGPQVGFAGIAMPWKVERALKAAGCELADFLHRVDYDGYISLEMKRPDDIAVLAGALEYLAEVFGA